MVPSDDNNNYIPKIQTIRNLSSDATIEVEIVNATDVADSTAVISVLEKEINMERGTSTIKARIFDKTDGSLTDSAQIVVYNNDRIVNVPIQRSGDIVTISGSLEIGRNNVIIEVLNTAGIATSSNVIFDYNPTIGSINGKIVGFTDEDNNQNVDEGSLIFMDIFDEQSNYINSLVLPENGEYALEDLEADKHIKLQAMEVDVTSGRLLRKTDLTSVTVPSAAMLRVDMSLTEVDQTANVVGVPVFDFLRDIRVADINDTTGIMNVSMTLSNYDKGTTGAAVGINVNGLVQEVPADSIVSTGADYSYAITDFSVQLQPGRNVVYGIATNPSGEFDYTRDQFLEWTPTGDSTLTTANIQVQGCDVNTTSATSELINCSNLSGISSIELSDQYGNFVNYLQTDATGAGTFTNLPEGNYTLFVQSENSNFGFQTIPMPVFGNTVENINVHLIRESEVIEVPEFEIIGLDLNSDDFQVNTNYNATVNISTSDATLDGYTFNWSYSSYNDENELVSTPLSECQTQVCTFSAYSTGWINLNVDISKLDVSRNFSQEIYIQELSVPTPPAPPAFPTL
jgi:hypothetical protein